MDDGADVQSERDGPGRAGTSSYSFLGAEGVQTRSRVSVYTGFAGTGRRWDGAAEEERSLKWRWDEARCTRQSAGKFPHSNGPEMLRDGEERKGKGRRDSQQESAKAYNMREEGGGLPSGVEVKGRYMGDFGICLVHGGYGM